MMRLTGPQKLGALALLVIAGIAYFILASPTTAPQSAASGSATVPESIRNVDETAEPRMPTKSDVPALDPTGEPVPVR